MSAILAFATLVGPPAACEAFCVKTRPLTSSVSSIVPPSFLTTAMSRRSTFVEFASQIESIASTASGASRLALLLMTFELREVDAALISCSRSSRLTGTDMPIRTSSAFFVASRNDSEMTVGWMPWRSSFSAAPRSEPAITVTVVVPSPASTSCEAERSTSIFAVGCDTCICFRIVAPSFVMTTSPCGEEIILSMPRGPSEVRTASATALAATMLDSRTLQKRRGDNKWNV